MDDVPASEWDELSGTADIDFQRGFLQFREYLEPGESVLLTARSAGRIEGALRGVLSVPESGLTSDPWKFVGSEAVLRLRQEEGQAQADALRREQRALVRGAGRAVGDTEEPLWRTLTRQVGSCLVVREFDRSELLLRPDLWDGERTRLTAQLLAAAQSAALANGAGAVALPFVSPADTVLRDALADAGFRGGALTGASWIPTGGFTTYEDFLAHLPSRRRRRYRLEERELAQAPHLTAGVVDLAENAARIAVLEANTLQKHGGQGDAEAIHQARTTLSRTLPDAVRIPAVLRHGELIACALHLQGNKSIVFMTYGCDYTVEDRGASYPWAAFYYPIRTAVESGVASVRLGLEGFEAKTRRGAVVEPRELWVWTPDADALGRLGELLDLVDDRNSRYLEQFTPHGQGAADRGVTA
ncbi:GNAT family N-acetyltransferase [Streptomyces sp. NPDC059928]|uniref:GNAT family N-acetyltransferase n=1 Tax=unclassified Streptomyces TaxID=2593676 RepID=UPI003659768C